MYKVVQQSVWGKVVDFIPAISAVHLNSERIIKTGPHAKLIAKIIVSLFFTI